MPQSFQLDCYVHVVQVFGPADHFNISTGFGETLHDGNVEQTQYSYLSI